MPRVNANSALDAGRRGSVGERDDDRLAPVLARARAGDSVAFEQMVEAHERLIFHIAREQLHGDIEMAQDACQEAILSAWQALGRFVGSPKDFKSWLCRIVVNAARDRLRHEKRRPHGSLEHELDGLPKELQLPAKGQTPQEYAENADLGRLLEAALSTLPVAQREVVVLDHAGFDYAEIAEALTIPIGTVRSRLHRARARMRDFLEGRLPRVDLPLDGASASLPRQDGLAAAGRVDGALEDGALEGGALETAGTLGDEDGSGDRAAAMNADGAGGGSGGGAGVGARASGDDSGTARGGDSREEKGGGPLAGGPDVEPPLRGTR